MSESEKTGTIYREMIERRSRSERLNALAVEKGLEVAESPEVSAIEADPEIEMKPAFDESEIQAAGVEDEREVQTAVPEDEASPMLPEEEQVSSEEAWVPEDAEPVFQEAEKEAAEPEPHESESFAEEPATEEGAAEVESEPNSVREIEESESILGEEPQPVSEDEVTRVAEDLVDRIGPVVDIQSLPKTQPSRILSKTSKPEEPKQPENEEAKEPESKPAESALPDFQEVIAPEDSGSTESNDGKPSPAKKKKKKVSLLDSYFKGL